MEGKLFETFNILLEKAIKQAKELKQGKNEAADGKWSYWGYYNLTDMPFHMRNVTRFYSLFIDPILRGYIDLLYPQLLKNPGKGINPYITEVKYGNTGLNQKDYELTPIIPYPTGYKAPDSSAFELQLGAKDEYLTIDFQKDFLKNIILVSTDFDNESFGVEQFITNANTNLFITQVKENFKKAFVELGKTVEIPGVPNSKKSVYAPITLNPPTNELITYNIKKDLPIFYKPIDGMVFLLKKDTSYVRAGTNAFGGLVTTVGKKGYYIGDILLVSPFYQKISTFRSVYNDDNIANLGTQNGWELYLKCRKAYTDLYSQHWDWPPRITTGAGGVDTELLFGFRNVNFKKPYGIEYNWTEINSTKTTLTDKIFAGEILTDAQLARLRVNNTAELSYNRIPPIQRLVTNNVKKIITTI